MNLPGDPVLLLRAPLKDLKSLTPETPAVSFEPIWEFLRNKSALIQAAHPDAHVLWLRHVPGGGLVRAADISTRSPVSITHSQERRQAHKVKSMACSPQAPALYLTLKLPPSLSLHGSLGSSLVIKACSSKCSGMCLLRVLG